MNIQALITKPNRSKQALKINSFYQEAVKALGIYVKLALYDRDTPYDEFPPEVYIETKGICAKDVCKLIQPLAKRLSINCRSLNEGYIHFAAESTKDGPGGSLSGKFIRNVVIEEYWAQVSPQAPVEGCSHGLKTANSKFQNFFPKILRPLPPTCQKIISKTFGVRF